MWRALDITIVFTILFCFNATAATELCKKTQSYANESEDFCMDFPTGRTICVSGHTHMLPRELDSFKSEIVASSNTDPEIQKQAILSIQKRLRSQESKKVLTGYTNQSAELIAIGPSKYKNIDLFIENGPFHFAKLNSLSKYFQDNENLAKALSPEEFRHAKLLALGPYLYLYYGHMKKQSPVHPSESHDDSGCDTSTPEKIDVKACITDRDADIAKNIIEHCQSGKTCYWAGGGAHAPGLARELQKHCSSLTGTDKLQPPPAPVPVPRPANRPKSVQ